MLLLAVATKEDLVFRDADVGNDFPRNNRQRSGLCLKRYRLSTRNKGQVWAEIFGNRMLGRACHAGHDAFMPKSVGEHVVHALASQSAASLPTQVSGTRGACGLSHQPC